MRPRALLLVALVALPAGASGQILRPPRTGRGAAPQPAPAAPEIPTVSHALAYRRSRWSAEAYSLISSLDLSNAVGGRSRVTTYGAGTRADYRYSDHFSATLDLTTSIPGLALATTNQTVEAGTRYSPLAWDRPLRPFFDVRAAYMQLSDTYAQPSGSSTVGGANQFLEESRYSRGFGGVAGTGLEYRLTSSLAISTELSALQNRMTTYRVVGSGSVPRGNSYSMTSYRLSLGLRFNPTSALHLAQNPGQ